jgi:hypothetical protein
LIVTRSGETSQRLQLFVFATTMPSALPDELLVAIFEHTVKDESRNMP